MKRREFIKYGVAGTSGVVILGSLAGCDSATSNPDSINQLFAGFQNPPSDARLFVRWWWNGNRLAEKEILRELDVMKAAGIGGVEINPIAFPSGSDPVGYEAMTIFDNNWLDMLEVALKGAKERGITCDMIVGSGWPFGGEFLEKDHQTQMVTIGTVDLSTGQHQLNVQDLLDAVDPALHSKNKTVYKEIIMARLVPKQTMEFTEGLDLTQNINNGTLSVDVPSGEHVLYYVVKLTGFMAVINGAPGAAGPVLNHYSKTATETYLNRISDIITAKVGDLGQYIRAMFCDSMELEGANWVDDLPQEFEKRRGYSLLPYLPYVLKKVGHMGNPTNEEYGTQFPDDVKDQIERVGIDYYNTRIELFKERFIHTFNDWCHAHNVQSRMQAYGRGMHPLEASMEIDIPECETWLFKDVGREYPNTGLSGRAPRMCNKYVSSGAVLANKKIVSCEEVTNTEMAFMATLENIKIVGDQSNISGVNHSILHGFNYSPPEAPLPGWIRYGAYFNERNTWWPHFKKWSDYKARLSYLFQNVQPQANIGILQPLTDLWLKHGPQRDPFPQHWYPEYQNNLWEVINQNGGGCDYISENIINKSSFDNGQMRFNKRSYNTILLPEIETLDVTTTESLVEFAETGGRIVFIGKRPVKSATYEMAAEHDARVKALIDELLKRDNVHLYPAPEGDLIKWFGKMQNDLEIDPYIQFNKTHKYLSQNSYESGDNKFYFIANTSLSEHISVKAEFRVDNDINAWIWNPETGEKLRYPNTGKNNQLQLELPRATSLLIVFSKESEGEAYQPIPFNLKGEELSGGWKLQLNHTKGESTSIELNQLQNLIENEQTKSFAGEVVYEKSFSAKPNQFKYIDLGDVQGVSELILNGKSLGVKWYGAHVYDVSSALTEGENELKIKLTTIIGNYLKSQGDNRIAQRWVGHQNYYPMGIMGPIRLI